MGTLPVSGIQPDSQEPASDGPDGQEDVFHCSASIVNRTRGRRPLHVSTGSVSPRLVRPDFSRTRMEARFSGSAVAHIVALCSIEKPKSSRIWVASVA